MKALSVDYALYLIAGGAVAVGAAIIIKADTGLIFSCALPLMAQGITFLALGYAIGLLKEVCSTIALDCSLPSPLQHSSRERGFAYQLDRTICTDNSSRGNPKTT